MGLFSWLGGGSSVVAASEVIHGSFTDRRDGQTYRTVKIGNQVWMAQNLNIRTTSGSWCYDDDESNGDKFGRLYDWETAMVVSPDGWHLPSSKEWKILVKAVGGPKVAGKKLKSNGLWENEYDKGDKNANGTDDYGFSALPGRLRFAKGGFKQVLDGGQCLAAGQGDGNWWTSSESYYQADGFAQSVELSYHSDNVYLKEGSGYPKGAGMSVRCVRDV